MNFFRYRKRAFDLISAAVLAIVFALPMLIIGLVVKITSPGPAIYWSVRIGRENKPFEMPKFRSMLRDTPQVASDKLEDPVQYLTPIGSFLRKSSLDELPQIWSIIKGDMSLVGPRPALFNQVDLIQERTKRGIHHLVPGVTGWAQINGRDELNVAEKVNLDEQYLNHCSLLFDIKIIVATFFGVLSRRGITH